MFLGLSLMFDYTTLYTIEESICIYLTPIYMSYFTLKGIPTSSICKFICLNYPIFIKSKKKILVINQVTFKIK